MNLQIVNHTEVVKSGLKQIELVREDNRMVYVYKTHVDIHAAAIAVKYYTSYFEIVNLNIIHMHVILEVLLRW